jgi:hypothetical protein
MQWFGCCGELTKVLEQWEADDLEKRRIAAEEHLKNFKKAAKKHHDRIRGGKGTEEDYALHRPATVIGFCPKCNSQLRGEPLPECETKKSGRYFYAECSACTYYYEIFKKRKKFTKTEGG